MEEENDNEELQKMENLSKELQKLNQDKQNEELRQKLKNQVGLEESDLLIQDEHDDDDQEAQNLSA